MPERSDWPPPETFGDRVSRLRRVKGLSNADIARATGVIPKTVSGWAKKGREPKGAALLALARLLEVSPEWLLTGRKGQVYIPQEPDQPEPVELRPKRRKRGA